MKNDNLNDDLGAGIPPRAPATPNPNAVGQAIERAKGCCEIPWCRASDQDVRCVIHHLTYERASDYKSGVAGTELPSDLIYVCEPCHNWLHDDDRQDFKLHWYDISFHHPDGRIFIPGESDPPDEPWRMATEPTSIPGLVSFKASMLLLDRPLPPGVRYVKGRTPRYAKPIK